MIRRIFAVTGALAFLGAVAGALGAALPIAIYSIVRGAPGNEFFTVGEVFAVSCAAGGVCGVLVAPLLSWTLLRDVPIWRSATETAFVAGLCATSALMASGGALWGSIGIAAVGALLAAARLRLSFRQRPVADAIGSA